MENKYKALFTPFTIGNIEVKNHIMMSPMLPLGWLDEDKNLTEDTIAYYTERAKGGVGAIFVGASFPACGLEKTDFTRPPFAKPNTFLVQTRKLVESCHRYNCKLFFQIQLGAGRTAVPAFQENQPVAPSPVANRYDPSVMCRAMTTEEVYTLIDASIQAGIMAYQAGCDGININGIKGGYLGDQFAIPAFNQRTDEFGGSIDGRIKILVDIVKGIKANTGPNFVVTTRLGTKSHMKAERVGALPGEEYEEFGRDMEESLIIGKKLEEAGYDGILFGTGTYDSIYWLYPPMYMPDGCYIDEAYELKKAINIPVIVPGKLSDPDMAEKALEEGKISCHSMARGLVSDPYWPAKVKSGHPEEIRPCIYCDNGCIGRVLSGMPMQCAVNPDAFAERYQHQKYAKVDNPKKIAIIGGGIAGMEAARVAATRGHKVTIYEKGSQLGGLILPSMIPDFKNHDRDLLNWFKLQLKKLNVEIQYNTAVTADDVYKLDADEIIVATGSTAKTLPGADGKNVMSAIDALEHPEKVGNNVVVIGGGQVGTETAIWLKGQGKENISIIEARNDLVLTTADPIPQMCHDMLNELVIYKKIDKYLNAKVIEVSDNAVKADTPDGQIEIKADTVIISIGFKPNADLYHEIVAATDKNVYLIGDAKQPATIMTAIRDGSAIGALV